MLGRCSTARGLHGASGTRKRRGEAVRRAAPGSGISPLVAIRQLRRSLLERPSQTSLAELLGVTRSAVADWEGGRQRVPAMVEIVARVLEANPELLAQMRLWRGVTDTTAAAARRDIPAPALPE